MRLVINQKEVINSPTGYTSNHNKINIAELLQLNTELHFKNIISGV